MGNRRPTIILTGVFILGVLILIGLTWANYNFAEQNPGGNDFLVHWVGTQSLIMDGLSPYSDEVAVRIQRLAYGRPALPGEHELRVAYPLYSIIFFAPFALIKNYLFARALWMTVLEVGLILLIYSSLRLTGWRPRLWMLLFLFLFTLLWYHSVRPVINGNAVILVALLINFAFLAIRSGQDEIGGFMLAFATIKPNLVVLLIPFILYWAVTCRRWRLVFSFMAAIALLTFSGMLIIPDWLLQNLIEVIRYPSYNPPGTPGAVLVESLPGVGRQLSWLLTIGLGILLLAEWFWARRKEFHWFFWTACLTLVISQWIGIQTDPGNFITMLAPLVLVFTVWEGRWKRIGRWLVAFFIILLFFGLWWLFITTVQMGDQALQDPIMFFPLPVFLFLALYWVRWWAIGPPRLTLEQVRINLGGELE